MVLKTVSAYFIAPYVQSGNVYGIIIAIIDTMPAAPLMLAIVLSTMVLFYAAPFDSIAYTASCCSYKSLGKEEKPHWAVQPLWCVLLILLPIALVFAESSINSLQSLSIVSAFPLGIIMILIVVSFVLDSRKELGEMAQAGFSRGAGTE